MSKYAHIIPTSILSISYLRVYPVPNYIEYVWVVSHHFPFCISPRKLFYLAHRSVDWVYLGASSYLAVQEMFWLSLETKIEGY